MRRLAGLLLLLPASAVIAAPVPPREERGRAGADCRAGETGPAYRIEVTGLRDRTGTLQLEIYPPTQSDFLAPDMDLIAAGKPFRRVVARLPATGPVRLCIRAPGPGRWALSVLHDRDGNGRFGFLRDGVGFPGNPRLGWRKPDVGAATAPVGQGVTGLRIVMNYRSGLGFAPLG